MTYPKYVLWTDYDELWVKVGREDQYISLDGVYQKSYESVISERHVILAEVSDV